MSWTPMFRSKRPATDIGSQARARRAPTTPRAARGLRRSAWISPKLDTFDVPGMLTANVVMWVTSKHHRYRDTAEVSKIWATAGRRFRHIQYERLGFSGRASKKRALAIEPNSAIVVDDNDGGTECY